MQTTVRGPAACSSNDNTPRTRWHRAHRNTGRPKAAKRIPARGRVALIWAARHATFTDIDETDASRRRGTRMLKARIHGRRGQGLADLMDS